MGRASKRRRRSDLECAPFPSVSWAEADLSASLEAVHEWVRAESTEAAQWYLDQKSPKASWSRFLRAVAIILATAGAAVPFVAALSSHVDLEWGYLLFALAAGAVGFDRFFGFSTAWMRYLTACQRIEAARTTFDFEWAVEEATRGGAPPSREQALRLLTMAREFRELIAAEVAAETNAWVHEFRSNITELRQLTSGAQQQSAATATTAPVTPQPVDPEPATPPERDEDLPEGR